MDRATFIVRKKYQSQISRLSIEQKAELLDKMFEYQNTWEYETWDLTVDMLLSIMMDEWVEDDNKYIETCNRNKENGKKWGRPTKDKPKKPTGLLDNPQNPSEPKKADKWYMINDKWYIKKEINKEKKLYLDYVYLTDAEYEKLIERYWDRIITDYIEKLNNWIWEKPTEKKRQNRNAYYTILNWLKNANIK